MWSGKHVLVTGGSSGVGRSAALAVAREGARVTVLARDEARLAAVRAELEGVAAGGAGDVRAFSADVADWQDVSAAVSQAAEELGPVDVLLACAGYCTPRRFVEADPAELRDQVETNLLGAIHSARAVAPAMVDRESGHIALVSSMGGIIGVYGYGGYSPSKFGVVGLAEVLRCELKPHGIGVTVVCPPNIDTPGYHRELETEPAETARINGSAKALSADAVAERMLRGVERGEFLVVPGTGNAALARMKGVVPGLFHRVFDRAVAAVRRES